MITITQYNSLKYQNNLVPLMLNRHVDNGGIYTVLCETCSFSSLFQHYRDYIVVCRVPRNFAMQMACNWPTAVSDQFKGSFPGWAILHIRPLRREEPSHVMNWGTTHATHAACASSGCNFGSATSWFTFVRNFDPPRCFARFLAPWSPASFEINEPTLWHQRRTFAR